MHAVQGDLFDRASQRREQPTTPLQRAEALIRDHPAVYQQIVRLARRAKASGRRRYGMKALFELVRWHHNVERTDGDLKLNNTAAAPLARIVMEREHDLADFFETRG